MFTFTNMVDGDMEVSIVLEFSLKLFYKGKKKIVKVRYRYGVFYKIIKIAWSLVFHLADSAFDFWFEVENEGSSGDVAFFLVCESNSGELCVTNSACEFDFELKVIFGFYCKSIVWFELKVACLFLLVFKFDPIGDWLVGWIG